MTKKLVILGGGGHAAVVEAALRDFPEWEIAAVLDDGRPVGASVIDAKINGPISLLKNMKEQGVEFFHVAVGSCETRLRLFDYALIAGLNPLTVIHKTAFVDASASVGAGSFVAAGSFIGPRAVVGTGAVINTHATIDHDCEIGDFAHVCPGVNLAGAVIVGPLTTIGTGSAVIPLINIGANAFLGAGSVVVKNIPSSVKAFGNPCRIISTLPLPDYLPAKKLVEKNR